MDGGSIWVDSAPVLVALAAHLAVVAYMFGSIRTHVSNLTLRLDRVEKKLWNGKG